MKSNNYSIQVVPATPQEDNPEDKMPVQAVHKLVDLRKIIPMRTNEKNVKRLQHDIFSQTKKFIY